VCGEKTTAGLVSTNFGVLGGKLQIHERRAPHHGPVDAEIRAEVNELALGDKVIGGAFFRTREDRTGVGLVVLGVIVRADVRRPKSIKQVAPAFEGVPAVVLLLGVLGVGLH